jgi:hypothetical protein
MWGFPDTNDPIYSTVISPLETQTMKPFNPSLAPVLLCALLTLGCSSENEEPAPAESLPVEETSEVAIHGTWEGANENRGGMSFAFHEDGSLEWIAQSPDGPVTMNISFAVVEIGDDLILELTGFDAGPMEGMVMYGRARLVSPDSLLMDLEPAPPGTPNAHPADLTSADVILLVRKRAP